MEFGDLNTLGIGGGGAAIVAAALWLRKFLKDMGLEDKHRDLGAARANAENNVLDLLRGEVNRLADMNKVLSGELAMLQREIVELRRENTSLRSEIGRLNEEISRLSTAAEKKCEECPLAEAASINAGAV